MRVAVSSPFVPPEWIAAHGLEPVRLHPRAGDAEAWDGPRTGLCPYARATAGAVLGNGALTAAVLTTTCDQMRRAAERLAARAGRPVFLMNVPATWQTATAARWYADELRRLGRFLVGVGGETPSEAHLCATLEAWDEARKALRGVLGTLPPREATAAVARLAPGAVPSADAAGGWRPRPGRIPAAVVGGPQMAGDTRVADAVESAGGEVVLDGTASGLHDLPAALDRRRLRDHPVLELADAYFGTIPAVFRRPNGALFDALARDVADAGARGAIVWRYLWCDSWAAAVPLLRERLGVPVLDLGGTDPDDPPGRLGERLEAFMEMLR
jgi:benzoyl-CoA reductase/2-hydroxyglutaryl-CoA dehydratase subunit BcrC/BadD/HgdB